MEDPKIEVGEYTIDSPDTSSISFVPVETQAATISEMSDEQLLETEEGKEYLKSFKEEITGEEKKEREETPAEETPPEKKEGAEEGEKEEKKEAPPAKTDKGKEYSKKVNKRIAQLTFKEKEAVRRAERAEAQLKEQDKMLRKTTTEKAKAEILSKKPNETDFETEAEYYEALGRWSTRSEMLEIESERSVEPKTDTSPTQPTELPPEVESMLELGAETYDDFDAVIAQAKTMPQYLVEEAMETKEIAHDIIYHLAKNQDEAARIAQLSPKAITREIGKIEAGLSAPETKTETSEPKDPTEESISSEPSPSDTPTKPKQTTNAPPPIKPIQPGATTTTPDQSDMTNAEYRASRGFTADSIKKSG